MVLFFLLCILIIFLASIFYSYRIEQFNSYYDSFLPIFFFKNDELYNELINDNDNYYEKFSIYDMRARNINKIDDYYSKINRSVDNFTEEDKEKIINNINAVNDFFDSYKTVGFDGKKINQIPWKIGKVKGKLYEDGLPHTRSDIIILPDKYIQKNDTDLAKLLIHEKVHIYQKKYPEDVQEYLNHHNIKQYLTLSEQFSKKRANPDLDDKIYYDDKIIYYTNYNNEYPESIQDITYKKNYGQKSEHPFEKMAIEIEEAFS